MRSLAVCRPSWGAKPVIRIFDPESLEGVSYRPQFGHILRTKPVPGRSWIARKTNIELMQLPQIHSRSPNHVL
jgi:hypothetical protein